MTRDEKNRRLIWEHWFQVRLRLKIEKAQKDLRKRHPKVWPTEGPKMDDKELAHNVRRAASKLNVAASNAANAGLTVEYDLIASQTITQVPSTYISAKVTKEV